MQMEEICYTVIIILVSSLKKTLQKNASTTKNPVVCGRKSGSEGINLSAHRFKYHENRGADKSVFLDPDFGSQNGPHYPENFRLRLAPIR